MVATANVTPEDESEGGSADREDKQEGVLVPRRGEGDGGDEKHSRCHEIAARDH